MRRWQKDVMWGIWVAGAVGFPALAWAGVDIDLAMMGGYGGIVTYMLWVTRKGDNGDDDDQGKHRRGADQDA